MFRFFITWTLAFLLSTAESRGFVIDELVGPPLPILGEAPSVPVYSPYIEGGELVVGREFPWVVSLRVIGYHLCGANILSKDWVLGVASCMFYNSSFYTIEVGTNSLGTGGTIHAITDVVVHEAYNESNSWANDIVLLKVSPPIEMSDGVSPAVLADKGQITPVETPATIAGWGALKYWDMPAKDLHKIEVNIYDHKKCEEAYVSIPKKVIYPTQICAASKEDRKGTTNGDSAAPLTVDGKVVGLMSWQRNTNELGFPSVYTEVSHYIDWINDHIKVAPETEPQPYIEGGETVEGREFPWLASLRVDGYHFCGANIINSEWVLGVASCMFYNWDSYSIMVGSNSLETGGTIHDVTKVVMHEAYNETDTWINDVAVLKVSPPIEMGNGVSPVVLVEQGQAAPPAGTTAITAGWGALQFPGPPANDMQKLEVVVVDHEKCKDIYAPFPKKVIYSSQICASGKLLGQSPTNGDSAAPLIVGDKVVAMGSWSQIVGDPGYPEVYTDLSYYIDWINEHIKD